MRALKIRLMLYVFLAATSANHWGKALVAEAVQTMMPKDCRL